MRLGSNVRRKINLFKSYFTTFSLFLFSASLILLRVLSLRAKSQVFFIFLVFSVSLLSFILSRSPIMQESLRIRSIKLLRPEHAPVLAVAVFSILFLSFFWIQRSKLLLSFLIRNTIISRSIIFLIIGLIILSGIYYFVFLKHTNKDSFLNCLAVVLSLLAIILQNIMIFRFHYFKNMGFPWDFPASYYAMTAFWTSTVTDAVVPNWVPFQQMGYPLALNLQSGINYPPFWTFPLFGLSYTLNRAVIFQVCHVLLGSIGMFFFLKASGLKPIYSLIGALAFQLFGGFYSNSEHVDIVRAFAIVPWLLYLFTFKIDHQLKIRQQVKIFLIPIGIFAMATGGYPGNFIAALFILILYSGSQLLSSYFRDRNIGPILRFGLLVVILTALGLLISFYHLGPAFFAREYLYRYKLISDMLLHRMGISIEHLPSLILTNAVTNGEPSMTSLYIGIPILLLSFFTTLKDIKRFFPIFIVGLFSAFMAGGPNSPLWIVLQKFISLLNYSRFPSSDYREFFCIFLVFIGVQGFSNLMTCRFKTVSLLLRLVLGISLVAFLLSMVIMNPVTGALKRPIESSEVGFVIALTVAVGILISLVAKSDRKQTIQFEILFAFLILYSGQKIVPAIVSWQAPNIMNYYDERFHLDLTRDNGGFTPEFIVDDMPARRPERQNVSNRDAFTGYLSGDYFINDLTPNLLVSSRLVFSNYTYTTYMVRAWTPILVKNTGTVDGSLIIVPENCFLSNTDTGWTTHPKYAVNQIKYDLNSVRYNVSITEPLLMIENESYFPGWTAELTSSDLSKSISAVEVNNVFRGWLLPEGTYQMEASFEFPKINLYYSISMISVVIWLALTIWTTRRQTQIES